MDCGPTCLRMIAKHYGRSVSLAALREQMYLSREGVSLLAISRAAESMSFRTLGVKATLAQLKQDAFFPCIAHWRQNHFIVVYKVSRGKIYVADPAHGLLKWSEKEFLQHWASDTNGTEQVGILLMLEPGPEFETQGEESVSRAGFRYLFPYINKYKKHFLQLILGLVTVSILQLLFPFLTQSLVDVGIGTQNMHFVYLVLIAQLVLFSSSKMVELLRSKLLLHIGSRINIAIISDFLAKILRLPLGFFDSKMTGDILQRIGDHHRIEQFLTRTLLDTFFSIIHAFIFSIVLLIYNVQVFGIFAIASILYVLWTLIFLKRRRDLDAKSFSRHSAERNKLLELIYGIQEIKLNNIEKQKRWEWERVQAALFQINLQSLSLSQTQQIGGAFINELKNILITVFVAQLVIKGDLTLGMMMSVTYIIGQLNAPIAAFIGFIQSAQDTKLSLERLNEIHSKKDEEPSEMIYTNILPENRSLTLQNVSFRYAGPDSPIVLDDISLIIPQGKITAIVGSSGSGKTTLLKLLLKFYPPNSGKILIGGSDIQYIPSSLWRSMCGVVMQEGYIFSDTIAQNIALEEDIDKEKLITAVRTANIQSYVENLPLGYNTKIGQEGAGLSQGQKQRLLIARAVYKNPEFLFFDEATNALDANNESVIMRNLDTFFQGKTVVVVAHRLSTVKNADQIIVLENGKVVETGTHESLSAARGAYFTLVKNQLELGS